MSGFKFPVEPLLRKAAQAAHRPLHLNGGRSCTACQKGEHYCPAALARELGLHVSTPGAWMRRGGVPAEAADAAAVALGFHPGNVWPDLWWATAPEWADDEQAEGVAA